ncbi:MAG: HAMP domain-containing protein [Thermoleophilia bacterium]|nr:HAMP domain-containing protein [Thermoleophilia bacterium]
MKRISVRARLVAATLAVTLVGVVAVGATSWHRLGSALVEREDRQLERVYEQQAVNCIVNAATVERALTCEPATQQDEQQEQAPPRPGAPPRRNDLQLPPGGWMAAYDSDGTQLVERRSPSQDLGSDQTLVPDADVLMDLAGRGPTSIHVRGQHVRVVSVESETGVVAVGVPLESVDATLDSLVRIVAGAAIVAMVLGLVLAMLLVTRGLRGLRRIASQADEIVHDEHLGRRLDGEDGPQELSTLASALNSMLDRLDRLFEQRRRSEQRLARFVSNASHELRTPITAIRGHAQLLVREPERIDAADRARTLERIDAQAGHLSALVDDLLDLARLDEDAAPSREHVDVTRVLRDCVASAAGRDANRTYELEVADDVEANVDRLQLVRAVDNLLANARLHTPESSTIRVEARRIEDALELIVDDDGPGIDEEQIARATDRFWRAASTRSAGTPGTGLGLGLVRAIAQAHGGTLELSRSARGGLRVRLVLAGA